MGGVDAAIVALLALATAKTCALIHAKTLQKTAGIMNLLQDLKVLII
jgi:hypothetical protein